MGSPSSLFERFDTLARQAPGQAALRGLGGAPAVSRTGLLDRVLHAARSLQHEGLGRGELVLVALAGESFVVALLAVWAADAVALLADPQLTPAELAALADAFSPHFVIGAAPGGRPRVERGSATPPVPRAPLPAGTAVIKLTSGSTGRPRGIATTAEQLVADARQIIAGMGIGPQDVNVGALPMSHSYGLSNLLLPLVVQGSPLLVVPSALPGVLAEALSIEEPAVFPGVPYLFDLLARPGGPSFRRRGLRLCISAGAPLGARVAAAFRVRYGLPVRSFYGTSETGGLAFDASRDGDAALAVEGCVGPALPGVELSLAGEQGRVAARSPAIACGYVGPLDDDGCGEFRDGAFLTGDIGRIDGAGRLQLTGRFGSFVNVSGRKVSLREVELALGYVDGVRDAAVVRVADAVRGEALVAYLVAEPGLTREQVLSRLGQRLAPWKLPRQLVFLQALPRSDRGKLDAQALHDGAVRPAHYSARRRTGPHPTTRR